MLGGEGGRCVETVMTSGGMIVAATWGGNLVDGISGRLHHHHHHHHHYHRRRRRRRHCRRHCHRHYHHHHYHHHHHHHYIIIIIITSVAGCLCVTRTADRGSRSLLRWGEGECSNVVCCVLVVKTIDDDVLDVFQFYYKHNITSHHHHHHHHHHHLHHQHHQHHLTPSSALYCHLAQTELSGGGARATARCSVSVLI